MTRWKLLIAVVLFCSVSVAADLAEKWQKRITDAETTYAAAVAKADNARFYAIQKANGDRLTVLKKALSDATKAGDFDAASAIKEKVRIAELDGTGRPKPRNTLKFGGHEYALVEDKVTWHTAKRRCEEMGGHLACLKSEAEVAFGFGLYKKYGGSVWVGATDEEVEGAWYWVDGTRLIGTVFSERKGDTNHLAFSDGKFLDAAAGMRSAFLCEWGE